MEKNCLPELEKFRRLKKKFLGQAKIREKAGKVLSPDPPDNLLFKKQKKKPNFALPSIKSKNSLKTVLVSNSITPEPTQSSDLPLILKGSSLPSLIIISSLKQKY